ncbi:MAG: CocE/NonD family hydrolase [Alphaproteobacteria bacterium]|nr:CocE/NonD family hydrolase [Alphaproteobacteria bacterium]
MTDTIIERDVMVAMRDGIRLATDIHRPARDGKPLPGTFPVLMERTPYGKSEVSRSECTRDDPQPRSRAEMAAMFVRRGYVVVYQDCRGRHGSQGSFTKYLDDGTDGYDTCAWIVKQPWCNGRIGTMGLSYAAHTQAALGCLDPPGLAAQVLDSGGFSDAFQGGIRQGGAFELKQATWAYKQGLIAAAGDPATRAKLQAEDIRAWFTRMPWAPGRSPVAASPEYEAYLFEQWSRGRFDAYWKQLGIYAKGWHASYANVPQVHMSSWYDPYPRTATENYLGLKAAGKGPLKLVLGPWTHGDRSVTFAGDTDFGPAATVDGSLAPDWREFRLRWFDRWLQGKDNGADRDATARLFVMGGGSGRRNAAGRLDHGGRWIEAADWPVPGTELQPWYLHADGALSPTRSAADEARRSYRYDPRDPVPSIGGTITSGEPVMIGGGFDQVERADFFGCRHPGRPLAERPDVLVFQTPVLTRPMTVIGPIQVKLWIASDAPDTDFTAKLVDVHPPTADFPAGFSLNVTDGILRCRYRDSWEEPRPLEPGRVVPITIDLFPTANMFLPGHRMRLDISSSNFPHFDLNPNSFEPEGLWSTMRVANNSVFVDASRPSHVVLPIVSL